MNSVTFTSAKEIMVSSVFVCMFVCQRDYVKTTRPVFTKFGGKVALGPRKKLLQFGSNLGHVPVGLDLG